MLYRFTVLCWTNEPIQVETELEKAIDLHAPLSVSENIHVTGHEPAIPMKSEDLFKEPNGDPWLFFVEGETNSPDWTVGEIGKAIRNYDATSSLGMEVNPGFIQKASMEEQGDILDHLLQWLHDQEPPQDV